MQRLTLLVALFCWGATPALGQEWQQYVNTEDGFAVNFPGSPNITETTWRSQLDYRLPARVYHVDRGEERLSIIHI